MKLYRKLAGYLRIISRIVNHPLHKGRRIKALANFLSISIAKRLTPVHQITIPYIEGAVLNWPKGATSVMICARYGLGEYTDMAFCLHLLREDDLFCDVGANAGVYTVLAGRAVGCNVVAIEPIPRTFNLLMQNIYANSISDKVDVRRCGVGQEKERLFFTSALWSYNHVVESEERNAIEVEVLTLDNILDGRSPVAIKIDVEGFEAKVLKGAERTLSDHRLKAVIIEMAEHIERYGDSLDMVKSLLLASGLSGPWWYAPEERMLLDHGEAGPTKYNQIFIRDPEWVAIRLRESRKYEVHGAYV